MQQWRGGVDPAALEATLRREVLNLRSLHRSSSGARVVDSRPDGDRDNDGGRGIVKNGENSRSAVLSQALGSAYDQLVELKAANREVTTLRKRLERSEEERAEVGRACVPDANVDHRIAGDRRLC